MNLTLLDRYLIKELLLPFLAGILAFTFILSGSTVLFNLIGDAVKYNIPFLHFIQLFLFKLPQIIALSFPMSMLLATLLAFGRLGNDLEILAFRASGISIGRLIIPVVIMGFLISLMTVWFNESVVPQASISAENLFRSYYDSETPTIKQNIHLTEYDQNLPSRIINVAEVDEGMMKKITVAEYETGTLARLISAKSGRWLASGGWEFYDGLMHNFSKKDPRIVTVIQFKKEFINIKINPLDVSKRQKTPAEMTRNDLKAQIELQKKTGKDPLKNIMDYHMKLSIAFASLIYSILGASIGLRPHRSSSAFGLGISLLIIFIYIILLSVGMGLGMSGVISPVIAAWLPNIVAGVAGLFLLKKVISQ